MRHAASVRLVLMTYTTASKEGPTVQSRFIYWELKLLLFYWNCCMNLRCYTLVKTFQLRILDGLHQPCFLNWRNFTFRLGKYQYPALFDPSSSWFCCCWWSNWWFFWERNCKWVSLICVIAPPPPKCNFHFDQEMVADNQPSQNMTRSGKKRAKQAFFDCCHSLVKNKVKFSKHSQWYRGLSEPNWIIFHPPPAKHLLRRCFKNC